MSDAVARSPASPPGRPMPIPLDIGLELDALAQDLADVDVALRRLDDGTYGTCEGCGAVIDQVRLEAFPALRRCPDHGGPPVAS